jgi:ABC-type antimicrobial peptide transport system permease subunit
VVGVVKDAKYESLRERPVPAAYYPYVQHIGYCNHFEVRYSGDPNAIIAEVHHAIGEVDRSLPVSYQNTLTQQVDQSIGSQALIAQLSTFFGLLAVLLACIGMYGLMSYAVTRRTNEIGIRMALGAKRSEVLWMVMRESLILLGLGFVAGLPAALAADRLVSKMLFGLRPTDPLSLAGAALLLLAFALLAGFLPARRASQVDPMVALRYE